MSAFTQRPDFSFPYPLLRFLAYGEAHARRLRFDTNFVRTLDALHMALIWAGLWIYLIENFGRLERIDSIPWYVPCPRF